MECSVLSFFFFYEHKLNDNGENNISCSCLNIEKEKKNKLVSWKNDGLASINDTVGVEDED